MIVLDTSAIIDLAKGEQALLALLHTKKKYAISQLSAYEYIRGLYLRGYPEHTYLRHIQYLQQFHILTLHEKALFFAAQISANLIVKGLTIEDVDCLIAGTCLAYGHTTIITKNTKHFSRIEQLTVMGY
ncbi:MAG: type II toxin-antitoxin system VapC family toxin [Candidatus Woesearchaeota archaeon]